MAETLTVRCRQYAGKVLGCMSCPSFFFPSPNGGSYNNLGGTMRLGSYPCKIVSETIAHQAYKEVLVNERHRHRYELNNNYIKKFEESGMIVSGIYPEKNLAEIIEIKTHPWFVGVQFHPEFKSRPDKPHPLFRDFIGAAVKYSKSRKKKN